MIDIVDIMRGINQRLKESFPQVAIPDGDITEDIPRPSFYLVPERETGTLYGGEEGMVQQEYRMSLFYFAPLINRGRLDLLRTKAALRRIMEEGIQVEEHFWVFPLDLTFTITTGDMCLETAFSVTTVQLQPPQEGPDMEELELS